MSGSLQKVTVRAYSGLSATRLGRRRIVCVLEVKGSCLASVSTLIIPSPHLLLRVGRPYSQFHTRVASSRRKPVGPLDLILLPRYVAMSTSSPRDSLAGHIGHLTPPQEQAFTSFRSLLASNNLYNPASPSSLPSHDDGTILRFLRARRFNIQAAYKQFNETEAWRKETKIEEVYEGYDVEEYEEAKRVFPLWTGRRDRMGHPFYVYRVGDLDKKVGPTSFLN